MRSNKKAAIREMAFKLFLTKDYSTVPLAEIEQNLNLSRGAMAYHYRSKQKLFIDVIDYYIFNKQEVEYKIKDATDKTLLEFIDYYINAVANTMKEMKKYLATDENTNITRAYMNLILQAERFYPGFNAAFNNITNDEIQLWKNVILKAVLAKEIKDSIDPDVLALTFRIMLFGKCFQDALISGLHIEELRVVLHQLYELIRIK